MARGLTYGQEHQKTLSSDFRFGFISIVAQRLKITENEILT